MPTVPLYIRARQWEQIREIARILDIPWQELVRQAIDEYIRRFKAEKLGIKVTENAPRAKKKV